MTIVTQRSRDDGRESLVADILDAISARARWLGRVDTLAWHVFSPESLPAEAQQMGVQPERLLESELNSRLTFVAFELSR